MNTQHPNLTNAAQQDACSEQTLSASARREMQAAYAKALLDQVDAAQEQIQDLQDDISLLQTAENALDMISENLAKVRRLAMEKQTYSTRKQTVADLNDEIRNLLMINMLVAEDTELNGHFLFRDDIIRMSSNARGELTLTTTRLPEIAGIDTNDTQATLDSLDSAARTINRQYERIAELMRTLLDNYRQLQHETIVLTTAQRELKQTD
jgi:flagellin-like hook-associated protein FlgL